MPMIIGHTETGTPMAVDLPRLIGSHCCIVGNSGAGKSGAIRKTIEVTHGQVLQAIIDPEEEFYTLREKYGFLVFGGDDSDAPATITGAADLALTLLRHELSAVIQINHLHADEQELFVAAFLDSLMSAPRDLWKPALVVLDEAHRFAPQEGMAASSLAVRDLTSRGRKRGFTAVLATQRMAKIEKNVTGDVNNWLLGRVGQSTDRRVAADALGFSPNSEEGRSLQGLPDRVFYAFGPAFARQPTRFRVDDTETTMVKAGQAKVPTPPAPEALRGILAGITAAVAAEKAQEASRTAADGGGSHTTGEGGEPPGALQDAEREAIRNEAFENGRAEGYGDGYRTGEKVGFRVAMDLLRPVITQLEAQGAKYDGDQPMAAERKMVRITAGGPGGEVVGHISRDAAQRLGVTDGAPRGVSIGAEVIRTKPYRDEPIQGTRIDVGANGKVSSSVTKVIRTLENVWPASLTFLQAAKHAGVGLKSSQFKTYEPELRASGLVEVIGDRYRAKLAEATGINLLDAYAARLSPAHNLILETLREAKAPMTREAILNWTGISPTSSTFSAAMSLLIKDLEVAEKVGDTYQLVEAFR